MALHTEDDTLPASDADDASSSSHAGAAWPAAAARCFSAAASSAAASRASSTHNGSPPVAQAWKLRHRLANVSVMGASLERTYHLM